MPGQRLVLDTNVVASALLWGGVPRQLLQAARDRRIQLFTSPALLAELAGILRRPKFDKKIAASGLSIEQLVEHYALLAQAIQPAMIEPTIHDDPDDDQVLACALAANADFIVSGDHHLLDLGIFADIPIVTVSEVSRLIQTA